MFIKFNYLHAFTGYCLYLLNPGWNEHVSWWELMRVDESCWEFKLPPPSWTSTLSHSHRLSLLRELSAFMNFKHFQNLMRADESFTIKFVQRLLSYGCSSPLDCSNGRKFSSNLNLITRLSVTFFNLVRNELKVKAIFKPCELNTD